MKQTTSLRWTSLVASLFAAAATLAAGLMDHFADALVWVLALGLGAVTFAILSFHDR